MLWKKRDSSEAEPCTHQYFKNISETPLLITKRFICLFKVFLPHAARWPAALRFLRSDVAFWQTCYAWRWKSSHNIRTDGKNKTYEKITADRRGSHDVNPRVCCSTSPLIYEPKIAAHRACGSLTVTTTWHHKNTPSKNLISVSALPGQSTLCSAFTNRLESIV